MRGVETRIQEIRHAVFTEVAKMAYEEGPVDKKIEALPYKIIPGETGNFRNDVFLERAIVGERLRMAMGLPYRGAAEPAPVSDGIMEADKPEGYYTPPLINVIKFACNACDEKKVHVTDGCQGCLAHPCMEVCPKKAISLDRVTGKSIIDQDACIKCGRCATVCSYNAIIVQERPCAKACGMKAITSDENGKATIDYDKCVSCGQCIAVCPTGALYEKDYTDKIIEAIADPEKYVVVQTAPSVRAALGEEFGYPMGTDVEGKMVAALRRLGFDKVFDTDFAADLTIMEEAHEFLDRVQNGGKLPLITSCSPGWIKYCEHYFPDMTENLSSCKSPQQMFGATLKTYFAEKMGIDPKKIVSVSVMPCTAKKFEIGRDDEDAAGVPDVDIAITTRELARMIKKVGLMFNELPDEQFDNPMGESTGAAVIFGATGGVMEAALRTAVETLTGEELKNVEFQEVRGTEGIKEATYNVAGMDINVAVASGLGNARKLLDKVKSGEANYHFIEIMGCPGGCVNGGGQPQVRGSVRNFTDVRAIRAKALYENDAAKPIRKSHENPAIQQLYKEYFG